jgi:hypothetical protein
MKGNAMYLSYDDNGNINGYGDSPEGFPQTIEAPDGFDPRAVNLSEWHVADGELIHVVPGPPPPPRQGLTHTGFRRLFTLAEQVVLDNFDIPEFAAAHPVLAQLGPIEKATLRTAVKSYETASEIDLDDIGVVMFVGALSQMGLLEGEAEVRVHTILAGYAPGRLPDSAHPDE